MKANIHLKSLLAAGFMSFLAACTPSEKGSVVATAERDSGIIGGEEVVVEEGNMQASINGETAVRNSSIAESTVAIFAYVMNEDGSEQQFTCTGSVLTANTILTAAHCVPADGEYKATALYVVFNPDLNSIAKENVRKVVSTVVHPSWGVEKTGDKNTHDLAVLKFAGPLPLNYTQANILWTKNQIHQGLTVTLAGYGLVETDGVNVKDSDHLRKVDVEVLGKWGKTEVVLDQSHGKGACHGDSGGPAFVNLDGIDYVWGITSRGTGKDGKDDCSGYAIYTNISSELHFIKTALKSLK